jgi:hypothetical protein
MVNKVITLIILFVALGLIALTAITILAKQPAPDANETPELYGEYVEQQNVTKPFLLGLNGVILFLLIAVIFAGITLFIVAVRKFGR